MSNPANRCIELWDEHERQLQEIMLHRYLDTLTRCSAYKARGKNEWHCDSQVRSMFSNGVCVLNCSSHCEFKMPLFQQNKCFAEGVHLAVPLLHGCVSCLGDGHYGSCHCLRVGSVGITEVFEQTSLVCGRQMQKGDFGPRASEFAPCLHQKHGQNMAPWHHLQGLSCLPPEWHDYMWWSRSWVLEEGESGWAAPTSMVLDLILLPRFFSYALSLWLQFMQNLRCSLPRKICSIPCHSLRTHRMWELRH